MQLAIKWDTHGKRELQWSYFNLRNVTEKDICPLLYNEHTLQVAFDASKEKGTDLSSM